MRNRERKRERGIRFSSKGSKAKGDGIDRKMGGEGAFSLIICSFRERNLRIAEFESYLRYTPFPPSLALPPTTHITLLLPTHCWRECVTRSSVTDASCLSEWWHGTECAFTCLRFPKPTYRTSSSHYQKDQAYSILQFINSFPWSISKSHPKNWFN